MKLKTVFPEDTPTVRKCLGMTEESIKSDVTALKEWLSKQPHLGTLTGVDEDKWLENYLILNKNSLEKAKSNLDTYFTVRWICPEVFTDRDMDTELMDRAFENTCIAFLPGLTPEGNRVVVYCHFTDDATDFHPTQLAKRMFAIIDICLAEAVDRVSSVIVLDLKNTRLNHLGKYNLSIMKNIFDHGWKAYPERIASIHVINPPPFMELALGIFKPFLKEKMRNRIQIHNKMEELHDHIPATNLPSDYGGTGPCLWDLNKAWQTKMIECKDLLETVSNHRSNEKLRQEGKNYNDFVTLSGFGQNGSFRKLAVD